MTWCARPRVRNELVGIDSLEPLRRDVDRAARAKQQTVDIDPRQIRLRPLTVAEIRDQDLPLWLVLGILLERTLVVIFGPSGSGKTFAALDLAMAIARGIAWFG